jgi:alpha-L-fucosidase
LGNPGIITGCRFYISNDYKKWKPVYQAEFSNIKNNTLWQIKTFETDNVRYFKFQALSNTENDNDIGYAEMNVITN